MKINGKNERIKREYARFLRDARGLTDTSIDAELAAIARFEAFNKARDFASFKNRQASTFKEHLALCRNERTRDRISETTQLHILSTLRKFFGWLADQDGYRSRIKRSDADYFNLGRRLTAIARTVRDIEGPTLEQVRHVVETMPAKTEIEKRDRAVVAFAILTGARDNAIASIRMKHVDLGKCVIMQDARDVRTKASKTIETWFLPVGEPFASIVADWISYLKDQRLWGLNDPLFPKTLIAVGENRRFAAAGLARECWSSATAIRQIFKREFERCGLPYFNPHSFRKTLTRLGQKLCQNAEEYKAWSQNVGHEDVMTTFRSYGQIDRLRQRDIILGLGRQSA
jgi:integrase/recombinase XerD